MSRSFWPLAIAGSSGSAGLLLAASVVGMSSILVAEVRWFQVARPHDYLVVVVVAAITSLLCFVVPYLARRLTLKDWMIVGVSLLAMISIPVAIWHVLHAASMLTFDVDRSAWSSVWGLALNKQAKMLAAVAAFVQMLAFALFYVRRSSGAGPDAEVDARVKS
jgi:hypothetical protein